MNEQPSRAEVNALRARAEELHKKNPDWKRKSDLDFLIFAAVVAITLIALRFFIGEPIRVDGPSMVPTLMDGERLAVEKVSYWFDGPDRGDVVICEFPGGEVCVKRVIGLPGETVQVFGGRILIDGSVLPEDDYWNDWIERDTDPVPVPEGYYFVVGDNRNMSDDSRSRGIGPIPMARILGRVRAVVWPLSEFRGV